MRDRDPSDVQGERHAKERATPNVPPKKRKNLVVIVAVAVVFVTTIVVMVVWAGRELGDQNYDGSQDSQYGSATTEVWAAPGQSLVLTA
jgi:flagellar basal body-associated protein FliL